jgi:hypothetical protein
MSDLADLMRTVGMSVEEAAANWIKAGKLLTSALRAEGEDEPMTDLPDMVAWVRQQIDEDERVARAATPGPWRVSVEGSEGSYISPDYGDVRTKSRFIGIVNGRVQPEDGRNAAHIARHDPARVLAEVAAKRTIVDHYEAWAATLRQTPEGWTLETATAYRMAMEWTVRQLAQPLAGRPGWREEWAT